jgi:hypothetical protein
MIWNYEIKFSAQELFKMLNMIYFLTNILKIPCQEFSNKSNVIVIPFTYAFEEDDYRIDPYYRFILSLNSEIKK